MTNQIEAHFPDYAKLTEATVNDAAMQEKTITAVVKIDNSIVPDFKTEPWWIEYGGERYILPTTKPQGRVEDSSVFTTFDLTFHHWAIHEMKRYFFAEMAQMGTNNVVPDKFEASLGLNLGDFVTAFNNVLTYYFGNTIRMMLNPDYVYDLTPTMISISNTKIWDVLTQMYELFGVSWVMEPTFNRCAIKVGYPVEEISHIFAYGFQGGFLKMERQVQSTEISNIIRGRGGSKNLPYRYFKDVDPDNPSFPADPDWIPELRNVYFTNLRDINFRYYVQGWKDRGGARRYPVGTHWAYDEAYIATKFDPIEWVKDDDSIAEYGEIWNVLDNNEDIFPTIQGRVVAPYGRIDEVVAVEQIMSDDVEESSSINVQTTNLPDVSYTVTAVSINQDVILEVTSVDTFTVPSTQTAHLEFGGVYVTGISKNKKVELIDVSDQRVVCIDTADNSEVTVDNLQGGHRYKYKAYARAKHVDSRYQTADLTITLGGVKWVANIVTIDKWANTFDIWIKNVWQSTRGYGMSDEEFADSVWGPILGDRQGNTAKVVFSSGWLATSQDYEFEIVRVAFDDRLQYNGVSSMWRLTLKKSEADIESTGLYVPSTMRQGNAGDHFFFIGIDMPHAYVIWAEEELNAFKRDCLMDVKDIKPTWAVTLDKNRVYKKQVGEIDTLVSQINAGSLVRIQDARLQPVADTLFVKSLSITFKDTFYPDVEITLSDDITPTRSTYATLHSEVSALQKQIGSISNIEQVVRIVGDKLYLRKDGVSDTSQSPTHFGNLVDSPDFRQGRLGGAGWGLYRDAKNNAVFEIDKIVARESLEVNEIISHQTVYVGGSRIESAAAIECTGVEDLGLVYKCYFDNKQGSVKNHFKKEDVAYSHTYNADLTSLRYYKMYVTDLGDNYIYLLKAQADGTGAPEAGDTIIQYGNRRDESRQYVKISDVIGGGYERYIEGLDSTTATGTEYYFAGKMRTGDNIEGYRFFLGKKKGEDTDQYIEWKNGRLQICGELSVKSAIGNSSLENFITSFNDLDNTVKHLQEAAGSDALTPEERNAISFANYLTQALKKGSTSISGGLILSSLIGVGSLDEATNRWKIMAGMNGQMLAEDSIAFFSGGEMVDPANPEPGKEPATFGVRMNGTFWGAKNNFRVGQDNIGLGDNIYFDKEGMKMTNDEGDVALFVTNTDIPDESASASDVEFMGVNARVDVQGYLYVDETANAASNVFKMDSELQLLRMERSVPASGMFTYEVFTELHIPVSDGRYTKAPVLRVSVQRQGASEIYQKLYYFPEPEGASGLAVVSITKKDTTYVSGGGGTVIVTVDLINNGEPVNNFTQKGATTIMHLMSFSGRYSPKITDMSVVGNNGMTLSHGNSLFLNNKNGTIMKWGSYAIRVSENGIEYTTDGGAHWQPLN